MASFYSISAARAVSRFSTTMLFAVVVSLYPDVWLVNDPLSEPNVDLNATLSGALDVTFNPKHLPRSGATYTALTWSVEPNCSFSAPLGVWV